MELVYLKNEEDYNSFKKQDLPVRIIINSKVKFTCSICNNESIKVFKCLHFPFICKHCTNRAAQLKTEVKDKKKNTCLERHGVENCFQSKEKMEKAKKTKLKLYGDENWNNRPKSAQTCLSIYGYKSPGQVPEFKEKMKQSCIKNFGYDNYYKTPECRQKMYDAIIDKKGFTGSKKEYEVLQYIKSFYNDTVISNTRQIIEGMELDIYLPELNIAFEFDGTYWHADPLYYDENYRVRLKRNQTAQELWNADKRKDDLCKKYGIKLYRIKEHEWETFNEIIRNSIYNIITKNKKE